MSGWQLLNSLSDYRKRAKGAVFLAVHELILKDNVLIFTKDTKRAHAEPVEDTHSVLQSQAG